MGQMMFRVDTSKLNFVETVSTLSEAAKRNGWIIPDDTRDLQQDYHQAGLNDMNRCTILYFCDPQGGYAIFTSNDTNKAMSVMMPMGVSVYETTDGQVKIAAMNLGLMSNFFSDPVKDVLENGGARYEKSLEAVIAEPG